MDNDELQPQHPSVQRYQISQLFEQLAVLQQDLRAGFAQLETALDSRLKSRDKQLGEHDGRIRTLEQESVRAHRVEDHEDRIRKVEGRTDRQQVVNAMLAAIGGAALALVVRVLVA